MNKQSKIQAGDVLTWYGHDSFLVLQNDGNTCITYRILYREIISEARRNDNVDHYSEFVSIIFARN